MRCWTSAFWEHMKTENHERFVSCNTILGHMLLMTSVKMNYSSPCANSMQCSFSKSITVIFCNKNYVYLILRWSCMHFLCSKKSHSAERGHYNELGTHRASLNCEWDNVHTQVHLCRPLWSGSRLLSRMLLMSNMILNWCHLVTSFIHRHASHKVKISWKM